MRVITIISLLVFSVGMLACEKDKKTSAAGTPTPTPEPTEGTGRGVIYFGSDSIVAEGICGAQNSLGYYIITIKDAVNPAKTFSIGLNGNTLPSSTTTYTLVSFANQDQDSEAILDFTEVSGGNIKGWSSDENSGSITLVVDGNKVTCNFSGIVLPYYMMYNDPPYDVNGTSKASFTFYK